MTENDYRYTRAPHSSVRGRLGDRYGLQGADAEFQARRGVLTRRTINKKED